ncbi:MAG: sulfate ABC transporter ATP-binding protein [Candidatus Reconcilbacillus cellulovorans]|uniref:Sulfate ABC transporter ATP-binding protein n=1 Tax=Candidatus Reconcilbacillus cellulovorans TaxID=1906605 RepID=A0A2A6DYJ1_9BACL|nr:MAG: sulfate ABC transporter ATP-binding protein [Candidatus Reconcilbacillus cellulovorans]
MEYLRLDDVQKTYMTPRGPFQVLRRIDLTIRRGEFVTLIGHSGCGKSTILSMIAGLEQPTEGRILFKGRTVDGPGPDRVIVFQNYSLLPWLSVWENVYEAVDAVCSDKTRSEKKSMVEYYLRMVGLWEHRYKKPNQISGGMKQRTALARAFAVGSDVLLLDEPFGALDALTRAVLQDELVALWRNESGGGPETVIMVTHDIDEAILLSDRIVVMTDGPAATVKTVIDVPIERPRIRRDVIHKPVYGDLKDELLGYLHHGAVPTAN